MFNIKERRTQIHRHNAITERWRCAVIIKPGRKPGEQISILNQPRRGVVLADRQPLKRSSDYYMSAARANSRASQAIELSHVQWAL